MPVSESQRQLIRDFRDWLERSLAGDARFAGVNREDRADESTLAMRWVSAANPRVWFEVAVRPLIPQIRVGILTDDRWKSEDLEDKIEESGDTMGEFVGLAFEESGLPWPEPPVEHYREQAKYFYFATPFEPANLDALADDATRIKTRQMLDGYHKAFAAFLAA